MFLFSLKNAVLFILLGLVGILMTPAFAHVSASHLAFGFGAGFAHPFSGLDHLLAMLAIGIWAAQNKRPAIWVLPVVFPVMMALGTAVAVAGLHFPGVEIGVASSVMILGLLITFAANIPVWSSSLLVSLFAIAHGYAHGVDMPNGASGLQFGAGFIVATALLHLLGLIVGLAAGDKMAAKVVRIVGAGIGATGVYLLSGLA